MAPSPSTATVESQTASPPPSGTAMRCRNGPPGKSSRPNEGPRGRGHTGRRQGEGEARQCETCPGQDRHVPHRHRGNPPRAPGPRGVGLTLVWVNDHGPGPGRRTSDRPVQDPLMPPLDLRRPPGPSAACRRSGATGLRPASDRRRPGRAGWARASPNGRTRTSYPVTSRCRTIRQAALRL